MEVVPLCKNGGKHGDVLIHLKNCLFLCFLLVTITKGLTAL